MSSRANLGLLGTSERDKTPKPIDRGTNRTAASCLSAEHSPGLFSAEKIGENENSFVIMQRDVFAFPYVGIIANLPVYIIPLKSFFRSRCARGPKTSLLSRAISVIKQL
jgi:hypothetical protein